MGVEEIKKWTGEKCRHLGRSPATGHVNCRIYSHKPLSCSTYKCTWLEGIGPDNLRPRDSGILLSTYPGPVCTVNIFDFDKAKDTWEGVVHQLLIVGMKEVRAIAPQHKSALVYREGNIYRCRLLPPAEYESIQFETDGIAVGHYTVKQVLD